MIYLYVVYFLHIFGNIYQYVDKWQHEELPGPNFVDFSRLIVYNLLVYVLMEFRGHTNNNLHLYKQIKE